MSLLEIVMKLDNGKKREGLALLIIPTVFFAAVMAILYFVYEVLSRKRRGLLR